MNNRGFIVITVLFMLLLLSVTAVTLSSRAGLQGRMASNQTDAVQGYFSQLAVIEQSFWKLALDPCWRVPSGESYTYAGQTYTRKVLNPDTATYSALSSFKDAVIISVTAPYASRPVKKSFRYYMDTISPSPVGTPKSVHVDSSGNVFFTDLDTHSVWKISASSGAMTRVAGTGHDGSSGDGGLATSAQLRKPAGVITDSTGAVYIADTENNRIRKVSTLGTISTIAGTGAEGYSGDGGPATSAKLHHPMGLALDSNGNLLFADSENNVIRKIDKSTPPVITTIAGTGHGGYTGDNQLATSAQLNKSEDVAIDGNGNIFIADTGNNVIRKIDKDTKNITTIAGNGQDGYSGEGSPATNYKLNNPSGVDVNASGNVYIADEKNCRIRKVTVTTSTIATFAGSGTCGYDPNDEGRAATSAKINQPGGVAVRSNGDVLISDSGNRCIRKVASGTISALAATAPSEGVNNSYGITAQYDTGQQRMFVYIADTAKNRVIKLDTLSDVFILVAGTGSVTGDGGQATSAKLNNPVAVALDSDQNLYFSEYSNNKIRKVDAATGIISTVAGNGSSGYSGDNGPATSAKIKGPAGLFVDASKNIYFADMGNNVIRKVDNGTPPYISTVAGTGIGGFNGDGIAATSANLKSPTVAFVDASGNMYISDTGNNRVRYVDHTTKNISTIVGTGTASWTGDGGPATAATINGATGILPDTAGNLYIADAGNSVIRRVNSHDGTISTIAGIAGQAGYNTDRTPAVQTKINKPNALALGLQKDGAHIYISDTQNNRIRVLYMKPAKELY